MADFNRHNRGGERDFRRKDFGRSSFGDRGADRQMFKTTCSNCGKECEVPFKPTGAKPVYCNDCFRAMGGPDSRRSDDRNPRRSNFGGGDNRPNQNSQNNGQPQNNAKFDELNAKLDKILAMLSYSSSAKTAKTEAPEEEKIVQDLQLQPEETTIIAKKKRAPKKTTPLPVTE